MKNSVLQEEKDNLEKYYYQEEDLCVLLPEISKI